MENIHRITCLTNTINLLQASGSNPIIILICDCSSKGSYISGINAKLANLYIYAHPYKNRTKRAIPGTIEFFRDPNSQNSPVFCTFNIQIYPGGPNYDRDTYIDRLRWFRQCLEQLKKNTINTLVFPYKFDQKLSEVTWNRYLNILYSWQQTLTNKCSILILDSHFAVSQYEFLINKNSAILS